MTRRGFTLVEMLVALVVFGVVSAATVGLLNGGLRGKAALAETSDRLKELQIARTILKADMAQMVDRPVREPFGGPPRPSFQGPQASGSLLVSFVRAGLDNPMGEARGSLEYVEYRFVDDTLVRQTRARVDATPDTPSASTVLLTGVKSAEIGFLVGGVWSSQWKAAVTGGALPQAIAFDLTLADVGAVRQAFLTTAWSGS